MKNLIFLFLLFLLPNAMQAQITEEMRSMVKGMNNALVLELPETESRAVKKWWNSYMKDYGARTKKVKGGNEYLSAAAEISSISSSSDINVYSLLSEIGDMTTNTVWFELGDEKGFVSSDLDNSQYIEAEKFLMRFALYVTKEKIKIELNEEEKEMKQLTNELGKLERDNQNYHREIEQAKERIKRAEANIVTNLENQEKAKADIENQQEVLEEVKKRLGEM